MNRGPKQPKLASADAASARNPGILIADDLPIILTVLKFELESRGFNVWLAVDGEDAVDLYRSHHNEIDLVLLDVQMPGLDGPHTLEALQRLNPDVIACFMTGNAGRYTKEDLLNRGATLIFSKPFRTAEIAALLERVVSVPVSTPCAGEGEEVSEALTPHPQPLSPA
jgi:CheY-like chemotaxis protein